jgi:hypothetical protein
VSSPLGAIVEAAEDISQTKEIAFLSRRTRPWGLLSL